MHEIVELVKALAWPVVAMYFIVKFQRGIGALLNEMPSVIRRVRSAQGLGIEIELEKIGEELPIAELKSQSLSFREPPKPAPTEIRGRD